MVQLDSSVKGLVFDIDRFAAHDGPGIRTIVFLKGCPLKCIWCHSPESQLNVPEILYQEERCNACSLCITTCPSNLLVKGKKHMLFHRSECSACGRCVDVCYSGALKLAGTYIPVGEMVQEVIKELPFFQRSGGGVTLSGGEPLMQPKFSFNFLLACHQQGIHTALETSGYTQREVLSQMVKVTDLILYDIKLLDSKLHRYYTGVPNEVILDNLRHIASLDQAIQVRIPCIPGINDNKEHIQSIAIFMNEIGLQQIALLPYNVSAGAKYQWLGRSFHLSNKSIQSDEYLATLSDICVKEGLQVQIGG
jgi:pyruvate formate lyase activating enzyme